MRKPLIDYRTIIATAVGGILLFFATVFLSSFLSSPPSRAEFDSLKTEFLSTQKHIDDKLKNIEETQTNIYNYLLTHNKEVSNGSVQKGPARGGSRINRP